MAQSQHVSNPRLHGHHVQRLMTTLNRSPSAAHEHRRLNGNRRRVFEKKLAALQKLEDECDQHRAGASSESPSSSFPGGHNFHVRVARVWVTCTHLLRGYDKLVSPSKLFEAQLADQRRHALAQKRIAERLRQADPPPPRSGRTPPSFQMRKLLKPTQHEESEVVGPGNKVNNESPVASSIKSWLQQPFVHLAHMASKKLGDRHASPQQISSARIPLVDSLSCAGTD